MKKIPPVLFLIFAILLVYGNTLLHSFHFDDIPSILEKPWIRGLEQIPQYIFSVFSRPLVILSFNLNHAISGFDVWSYHVFNILFHMTATCLVYRLAVLIEKVLQRKNGPSRGHHEYGAPLLSAFIFALHPLSTQSVTYISSRSTIMVTIFYLATLILFFKGLLKGNENSDTARRGKLLYGGHWFWAGVCFFLGILSKQTIVTLPVMMFLFHYYFISSAPFPRWFRGQVKWMALIGIPVVCALTWKQFLGGGIISASQTPFSTASYLLTQTFVIPFEYFRKFLFPFNLNIDVNFPFFSDWSLWANWIGVMILLMYAGLCIQVSGDRENSMNRRWIGFGMAWILITLLPTSSFVPLLDMAVEHRTYLPMVGFSFLLAGMFNHLTKPAPGPAVSHGHAQFAVWTCAIILLVFYSAGVIKRNTEWKDEVSLWTDAKKKSPRLVRPYNNLGEAYDKRGEYDRAIPEFEAALELNPKYFFALNNLGNIYGKKKNYPEAIAYFKKALRQKADYSPAHYNLARALHLVGKPDAAIQSYSEAIRFNPYFEQAFFNLANLLLQRGKAKEATTNFNRFLNMQPNHARARFGLGNAYAVQGKLDLAYAQFQQSAALDPDFVFPHVNMANIEMQKGNIESAIEIYNRILLRDPKLAGIHKNLGMIFYQFQKNRDKAAFHFKESLRLEPDQPQAAAIRSLLADSSTKGKLAQEHATREEK